MPLSRPVLVLLFQGVGFSVTSLEVDGPSGRVVDVLGRPHSPAATPALYSLTWDPATGDAYVANALQVGTLRPPLPSHAAAKRRAPPPFRSYSTLWNGCDSTLPEKTPSPLAFFAAPLFWSN